MALLWQAFLARCYDIPLRLPAQLVLALTVWAIYLTDRHLDVTGVPPDHEAERHRFHRRWRKPLFVLLIVVLLVDIIITLIWIRPALFHNGLFALAGVIAYLGFLHLRGVALPKEILVAALYTIGVFLAGFTNTPSIAQLIFPALSFLALCMGNLFIIEAWEQKEFHRISRFPIPSFPITLGGLLLLSVICLAQFQPWYGAIGISALLMVLLTGAQQKISYEMRRVLIDAALLTPVLFRG